MKTKNTAMPKTNNLSHLQIIERLKRENAPVYNWFVERGIDLSQLGKYVTSLSAALAVASSSVPTTAITAKEPPEVQASVQIRPEELKGKSDLERANLVWSRYGHLIRQAASKYDLDPNLIFATIMVESGGNTYAIRHEPRLNDASYGLGQLLYSTAKGLGYTGTPAGLYDPSVNIDLIARYHRRNYDHYKQQLSAEDLTVAYNTGSPYKKSWPGHLKKFDKWYNSLANLQVDLS